MYFRAANLAFSLTLSAMSLLAETHADSGLVVETNAKSRSILVSCAEIPGYMAPMEMWFKVRLPADLNTLKPGMQIRFNIVTSGHELYAEQIKQQASEISSPNQCRPAALRRFPLLSTLGRPRQ